MGFDIAEFSHWLKNKMDEQNISQIDFAHRAGITVQTVRNILTQNRRPGPTACIGIARALNLPPSVVYMHAGLLPQEKDKAELETILSHKITLLNSNQQQVISDLVDSMLAKNEDRKQS